MRQVVMRKEWWSMYTENLTPLTAAPEDYSTLAKALAENGFEIPARIKNFAQCEPDDDWYERSIQRMKYGSWCSYRWIASPARVPVPVSAGKSAEEAIQRAQQAGFERVDVQEARSPEEAFRAWLWLVALEIDPNYPFDTRQHEHE